MGDVWDWVSGGWDWLVDQFQGAIDWVSEKVGEFVAEVVIFFVDTLGYVFPGLDDIIYDLAEILYDVWDAVGEYLTPVIQAFGTMYGVPYTISGAMINSFETLLEELHTKEMEEISDIEQEIREEWYLALVEIEGEIIKYSTQLMGNPFFLSLLLRITRNKVLEVSNLLGRPYIVAETEWIGQLLKILNGIKGIKPGTEGKVGEIFRVIDELIYRPYCDTKGSLALTWFSLFEGLINASSTLNESTEKVKKDLQALIDDLPQEIKDVAFPADDKLRAEISQWRNAFLFPELTYIKKILQDLSLSGDTKDMQIKHILDRLIRPADYLGEIDDTDPRTREDQEDKVTDLSHRRYARDSDALTVEASDTYDRLDDMVDAGQIPVEPIPWKQPTVAVIKPKTVKPTRKCETWFRGDY